MNERNRQNIFGINVIKICWENAQKWKIILFRTVLRMT